MAAVEKAGPLVKTLDRPQKPHAPRTFWREASGLSFWRPYEKNRLDMDIDVDVAKDVDFFLETAIARTVDDRNPA